MIADESMTVFKDVMFPKLYDPVISALLKAISKDRNKEQIDRHIIFTVIQSFKDMGLEKPMTDVQDGTVNWQGEKCLEIY
jgi:hypothetical protein